MEDVKGEFVIVKMTFADMSGCDLAKTVRLKVDNGRVYATELREIEKEIQCNLNR